MASGYAWDEICTKPSKSCPHLIRNASERDERNANDKFRVVGGLHAVWSVFDTHLAKTGLYGYTQNSKTM